MPLNNVSDEEDLELESSTSTDIQDAAAAPANADAAEHPEPSSSSEDESGVSDLFSVVRDVVGKKEPEAAASSATGDVDGQVAGDVEKKDADPDDEDYSDVPFHKHPRFQNLLRERKAYKHDSEQLKKVTTFIDANGLSAEDAANAMVIAGLMKTNPPEAWKRLKPLVVQVLEAAGETLSPDLKAKVEAGEMSRDAALEVSRSQAQVKAVETGRTFEQERQAREAQNRASEDCRTAASSWQADREQKDPNFASKSSALQREIVYLQRTEGAPTTPEGVRKQLDKAYKAVNDALPPARPTPAARPAVKPVTTGQSVSAAAPTATEAKPNGQAKEKSTMDILKGVVSKRAATG